VITVRADIKRFFFDRERVLKAVPRARRRALSKAGAFIRTRARTSIRKRRGTSPPGSPPYSHVGTLRKGILFGYDPARESVVIGPVKTNQVFFDKHLAPVRGTAPEVLEFGGDIWILEVFKAGRWQRADLRSRRRNAGLEQRYRKASIAPRPFMGPALEAELAAGTIPKHWANSVRSGS